MYDNRILLIFTGYTDVGDRNDFEPACLMMSHVRICSSTYSFVQRIVDLHNHNDKEYGNELSICRLCIADTNDVTNDNDTTQNISMNIAHLLGRWATTVKQVWNKY